MFFSREGLTAKYRAHFTRDDLYATNDESRIGRAL